MPSSRAEYCGHAHRQAAYRHRHARQPAVGFCPFCGARVTVAQLLARRAPALPTGNVAVDLRRELAGKDRRRRWLRVLAGVPAAVLVALVSGAVNDGHTAAEPVPVKVVSSGPAVAGELATLPGTGEGRPARRREPMP